MGLRTWKNAPHGKVLKTDVGIAKNYLDDAELSSLNHIVSMYLDYAELQAKNKRPMKMRDWIVKLGAFLQFNEYDILTGGGKVKHSVAKLFAEQEYETFRKMQDAEYESDFDRLVRGIKSKSNLPPAKS